MLQNKHPAQETVERTFREWCDEQIKITDPAHVAEWVSSMSHDIPQRETQIVRLGQIRESLQRNFAIALDELEGGGEEEFSYQMSITSEKEEAAERERLTFEYFSLLYPGKREMLLSIAEERKELMKDFDFDRLSAGQRTVVMWYNPEIAAALYDIDRLPSDGEEIHWAVEARKEAQRYIKTLEDPFLQHILPFQNLIHRKLSILLRKTPA